MAISRLKAALGPSSSPTFAGLLVGSDSISAALIGQWNTAYGWGDHADAGYLTSETDPVFGASPAADIDADDIANWNTAYSGNHAAVTLGSLTGVTLTGQQLSLTAGYVIPTTTEETNWNAAYSASHDAVTLGTANGLSLSGQELSFPVTASPTFAALTIATGNVELWESTDSNPILHFSGYNVGSSHIERGRLEVHDYGGGATNNNVVLGASADGDTNIRLQVDSTSAHIGLNTGATTRSAFTVMRESGTGDVRTEWRSGTCQSGGDTTERASAIMSATGLHLATETGGISLSPLSGAVMINCTTPLGTDSSHYAALSVNKGAAYYNIFNLVEDTSQRNVFLVASDTASHRATFSFWHCRGSYASPASLSSGDSLGTLTFGGYGGAWANGASIEAFADGEWNTSGDTTDAPARLVFSTAPDGSFTLAERVRITSGGDVGIRVSAPNEALEVGGKIRANTAFNINGTDGLTSQVVALAKLTSGGADGSITITGGIVTAYTAPT
jgi:hypothetical protein